MKGQEHPAPGNKCQPFVYPQKVSSESKGYIWGKKTGRKPETWLSQALPGHGRMCSFLVLQPNH